ncbi:efflux RND transporter permease subunit, partial [Salmonella enterica subsp. enterica serovar Kentucky]|nr:efflux RND transporter permease subunit [Salmonella enterica subsp. enterica serovar Kentucky]
VRLGDVASVTDSVQDVRNAGMTNAKPAILLMIRKLPEANIIHDSVCYSAWPANRCLLYRECFWRHFAPT